MDIEAEYMGIPALFICLVLNMRADVSKNTSEELICGHVMQRICGSNMETICLTIGDVKIKFIISFFRLEVLSDKINGSNSMGSVGGEGARIHQFRATA